jgi:hypothetical protein
MQVRVIIIYTKLYDFNAIKLVNESSSGQSSGGSSARNTPSASDVSEDAITIIMEVMGCSRYEGTLE